MRRTSQQFSSNLGILLWCKTSSLHDLTLYEFLTLLRCRERITTSSERIIKKCPSSNITYLFSFLKMTYLGYLLVRIPASEPSIRGESLNMDLGLSHIGVPLVILCSYWLRYSSHYAHLKSFCQKNTTIECISLLKKIVTIMYYVASNRQHSNKMETIIKLLSQPVKHNNVCTNNKTLWTKKLYILPHT